MSKFKLAIFDLTDCEGCETEFLSLRESDDFKEIGKHFDIVNWRLATEDQKQGPYDVAIVEGSAVSRDQIKHLKDIRKNSKILIALGACAGIGGIPSILKEKDRKKLTAYVYGKDYTPTAIDAKPIDHHVKIDYYLSGCPASPREIKTILSDIINMKPLRAKNHPVCLECKARDNECLFTEEHKPCLGSITKGGCGAICPSGGLRCYGCWGLIRDANFPAMIIALKKQGHSKKEIRKIMDIFWEENDEFQKYLK